MTERERRIGVYVCHCGGNISDYVDVDQVIASIADEGDVVVSKTAMFTCVYSYGLSPARAATPLKVYVWSFGEHEATTSPSSC